MYLQPLLLMKEEDARQLCAAWQGVNLMWWERTVGYCTEDKDTTTLLNTVETMLFETI